MDIVFWLLVGGTVFLIFTEQACILIRTAKETNCYKNLEKSSSTTSHKEF